MVRDVSYARFGATSPSNLTSIKRINEQIPLNIRIKRFPRSRITISSRISSSLSDIIVFVDGGGRRGGGGGSDGSDGSGGRRRRRGGSIAGGLRGSHDE